MDRLANAEYTLFQNTVRLRSFFRIAKNDDYWLFKTDASGNIVEVPDVGQR
ncbi:hypothetical protein [Chryseobacterium sp. sg2396]|uniref:hypothetical protein n=1 Tax=Chryseobacterium sp. sg2396 TaxID=3276280 RepID=UPI003671E596